MNLKYQGVILGKTPTDYVLGGAIELEPLTDYWEEFLIGSDYKLEHEIQRPFGFETYACFPYNAMVLMEDLSYKRISEIKAGDYVISHKGRKQKVLHTMRKSHNDKMIVLNVKGVDGDIICTKEHPFFTENGWVEAKDLNEGEYLLEPLNNEYEKDTSIYEIEKNPDFLWFLGLFLAEGNLGIEASKYKKIDENRSKVTGSGDGSGSIVFSLNKKEECYQNEIVRIGLELFDTKFTIYKKENKASVVGYNYHLKELLLELCGKGCYNKKIANRLMLIKPSLQLNILRGWLDGDGFLSFQRNVASGATTSEKLIKQMSIICNRNNIRNTIRYRKPYINEYAHRESWEIFIHGNYINRIYKDAVDIEKPNNYLVEIDGCQYFKKKINKVSFENKVKLSRENKTSNSVNKVYNIEVEKDNSYIVNGIAVHNCTCYAGNDVKELIMMWALKNNKIPREDVLWLSEKGYFRNGVINFDDRVPAMHAEIKKGIGTYQYKAGNALRKWSLPEGILKDTPKNFEEYMDLDRLTNEAKDLQKEYDKRFIWNWFWFDEFEGDVKQELKTSPAMSCVKFANGEGCLKPAGRVDHAVTEYKIDKCHHIDDSYIQQFKKYHPDYIKNRVGFKLTIKKHIKPMKIEDNKLYMLVEGPEQKLAMGLDNKLWVYSNPIDTLLNSASRSGAYQIPKPITLEMWNSVPKVNGKGEVITN